MRKNIVSVEGKTPIVHNTVYVDPTARVIGNVKIEERANIWAGTIIRADEAKISIGKNAAILENCVVEAPKGCPIKIGARALISHGAILHGCIVKKGSLVGIGAIVLDKAQIGEFAIIGSGAVIPPNTVIPDRELWLGVPAKRIREVKEEEIIINLKQIRNLTRKANVYLKLFANDPSVSE